MKDVNFFIAFVLAGGAAIAVHYHSYTWATFFSLGSIIWAISGPGSK